MLLQPITVPFSKSTLKPSVYTLTGHWRERKYFRILCLLNPLSPKIDFYVDLLICATSWASNHKFMLLSKIFQETYYL